MSKRATNGTSAQAINGGPLTELHGRPDLRARVPFGQFEVLVFTAHGIPQLAVMGPGPGGPVRALANVFINADTAGELRALSDAINEAFPQFSDNPFDHLLFGDGEKAGGANG